MKVKGESEESNHGTGTVSEKLDLPGFGFMCKMRVFTFSQVAFSSNFLFSLEVM